MSRAAIRSTSQVSSSPPALTAAGTRRTVYGKVSRYKTDQFLQLFDFPAATISAEQRFTTNVPLQRLFFMNSDFMQQQAERLAQKLQEEPDNRARVTKAYRVVLGRDPQPAELTAGVEFLAAWRQPLTASCPLHSHAGIELVVHRTGSGRTCSVPGSRV